MAGREEFTEEVEEDIRKLILRLNDILSTLKCGVSMML